MRQTVSPTKAIPLYNLERWLSVDGKATKQETLAWKVPYGMAEGLRLKAAAARQFPGTFFKIVNNVSQTNERQESGHPQGGLVEAHSVQ